MSDGCSTQYCKHLRLCEDPDGDFYLCDLGLDMDWCGDDMTKETQSQCSGFEGMEEVCSTQCRYYGGFCNNPAVPWTICGFRYPRKHCDCPWYKTAENEVRE